MNFKSDAQERNFRFVLTGLRSAGYGPGLLFQDYTYTDILASHSPKRVVPAAAFGRTPPSFDTACISVLLADRRQRSNIVDSYRAIGAPIAFEVDDGVVRQWRVSAVSSSVWREIPASSLESEFARHAHDWSPDSIVRAKHIAAKLQSRQLDFVDLGLLPALEEHVREKLDALLKDVLTTATKTVREELAKRFSEVEIVALPDRVFNQSRIETAVLLASAPIADNPAVRVSFAHVRNADRERFLSDFAVSWQQAETKPLPSATASFMVTPLADVWEFLKGLPTIGDIATLHRGVQWQPPFDEDKYISKTAKPGFRKGFYKLDEFLMAFQPPATHYLSFRKKDQLWRAFEFDWDRPKVFVNAATVSRGGWRLAAFADDRRHCSSQRFIALWPTAQIPITVIAALLNGPVANAYVACRENKRDIRKKTLQGIPVPNLNRVQLQSLSQAVDAYQELWSDDSFKLKTGDLTEMARRSLLEIDAILLRAYNLPPRLERGLLDFFRGSRRRVPFEFTEYFPANFGPNIPLWMYLTNDFAKCNSKFLLDSIPEIDDPALVDALTEVE